jgi:sugar/nucleoside kinase (ribokinase family)
LNAVVDYVNQAGFLHLSSFTRTRQLELQTSLVRRIAQDVTVSLTPGALYVTKGIDALSDLLSRCDVLFLYEEQLFALAKPIVKSSSKSSDRRTKAIKAIFEWKRKKGGGRDTIVVVKPRSHESSQPSQSSVFGDIVLARNQLEYVEMVTSAPILPDKDQQEIVDSTGAGDALAAGILFGLYRDMPIKKIANVGQIMSILAASHIGARQGLPTVDVLQSTYKHFYGTEM